MDTPTPPQEPQAENVEVVTKHHRSLIMAGIFVLLIILVLALIVFAVISKKASSSKAVCTDATVTQYNQAIKSTSDFAAKMKEVATSVESKPGYEKDSTCVYIAFQHYAYVRNADKTRQLVELLKQHAAQKKQLNPNVLNPEPVKSMEQYVESLEYSRSVGADAEDTR